MLDKLLKQLEHDLTAALESIPRKLHIIVTFVRALLSRRSFFTIFVAGKQLLATGDCLCIWQCNFSAKTNAKSLAQRAIYDVYSRLFISRVGRPLLIALPLGKPPTPSYPAARVRFCLPLSMQYECAVPAVF